MVSFCEPGYCGSVVVPQTKRLFDRVTCIHTRPSSVRGWEYVRVCESPQVCVHICVSVIINVGVTASVTVCVTSKLPNSLAVRVSLPIDPSWWLGRACVHVPEERKHACGGYRECNCDKMLAEYRVIQNILTIFYCLRYRHNDTGQFVCVEFGQVLDDEIAVDPLLERTDIRNFFLGHVV